MKRHYFDPEATDTGRRYVISRVIAGIPLNLISTDGVFSKKDIDLGTEVILEYLSETLQNMQIKRALDMGCGSGAIGIFIAKLVDGVKVTLADINPVAVKVARLNVTYNGVNDKCTVIVSDLFSSLGDYTFDIIVSNPPISAGNETLNRFIIESRDHLVEGGRLIMILKRGEASVKKSLAENNYTIKNEFRRKGYSVIDAEKIHN